MPDYILGLDLGPNSIGWALVEAQQGSNGQLRPLGLLNTDSAGHPPLGVRVFEAGLAVTSQGQEVSRNDQRRSARATRRTLSRRKARKRKALAVLREAGLLPVDDRALAEVMQKDPYELRARALHAPLADWELGRALYHLAQRRGFKSNRIGDDQKESSKLKAEISKLEALIEASEARTLGEYLHLQRNAANGSLPPRLRARSARMDLYEDAPRRTRRSMYEAEFALLLERQEVLTGHSALPPDLRAPLHHALFHQVDYALTEDRVKKAPKRANLHRAPGVRPCPYEQGQKGCPKSDWLAQRFRILKDVRSLRVSMDAQPERPLSLEEANYCLEELSVSKTKSFSALGKAAAKKFGWTGSVAFNLERGGRKGLEGNDLEATLSKAFGKSAWRTLDLQVRETIRTAVAEESDEETLRTLLVKHGLIDESKSAALLAYQPKSSGYLAFSRKALTKILPKMEDGLDEYDAIQAVYGERTSNSEASGFESLPSLVALCQDQRVQRKAPPEILTKVQTLTNPKVQRALVEVRKVVNAIVREHGRPARIVVEMAREMKQGRKQREEASKRNRSREKRRETALTEVKKLMGHVARGDVDRWLFWDEQARRCPYCDKCIGIAEAFSEGTEVDHIRPRSRSLDDSKQNKVLCCANCNAAKGNRTPVEWRGADSQEHRAMMARLWKNVSREGGDGKMPYAKVKRMETLELDSDEFASRQLNDTAYIAKLVSQYLLLLYPRTDHQGQKRVLSSRGSLTAHLRRLWGLNGLMAPLVKAHGEVHRGFEEEVSRAEKSRLDHRHHAVDALVVALSSRAFTKRLQDHWRTTDRRTARAPEFPEPWEGLRDSVRKAVERINVSHRPQRRRRGGLHKETFYGKVRGAKDKYATRKSLDQLTTAMLKKIVEPDARYSIEKRLFAIGWDGKADISKLNDADSNPWWHEPVPLERVPRKGNVDERGPRRSRPIFRVRVHETKSNPVPLGERGHRFADTGDNACVQIVEPSTGPVPSFRVIPRFHAQGGLTALPEQYRELGTLHRKDTVLVRVEGLSEPVLGVVQVLSGEPELDRRVDVLIRNACDSRPAKHGNKDPLIRLRSGSAWNAAAIQGVEIDCLGRILRVRNLHRDS